MNIFLITLLAIGVAAAPQAPPSKAKPKTYDELAPVIHPAAVIDEKPLIKSNAKRQLVRYGPFDLPALKVCVKFYSIVIKLITCSQRLRGLWSMAMVEGGL
jgi:hypothetical protein